MQKIITLIITASILYMIFQQNLEKISTIPSEISNTNAEKNDQQGEKDTANKPELDSEVKLSGNIFEKALSKVLVNVLKTEEGRMFLESMLRPVNKSAPGSKVGFKINNDSFINSIFQITTFDEGQGNPVACGHIVTAHYKILNSNNMLIKETTATFQLGADEIAPGLDAIIVGMRVGQTRHATIVNKYIPGMENDKLRSFKVNVVLKSSVPKNFIEPSDVKIFDDEISYDIPMFCGNRAIYDAKITRLSNNEIIYNSTDSGKKIDMKIGNLNYPMIFSYALHNKTRIGTRTVIARGELFKSYVSNYSTILKNKELPANEYFMIEFSNFDAHIGK